MGNHEPATASRIMPSQNVGADHSVSAKPVENRSKPLPRRAASGPRALPQSQQDRDDGGDADQQQGRPQALQDQLGHRLLELQRRAEVAAGEVGQVVHELRRHRLVQAEVVPHLGDLRGADRGVAGQQPDRVARQHAEQEEAQHQHHEEADHRAADLAEHVPRAAGAARGRARLGQCRRRCR
ncbi:hypothetical protein GCM10018954_062880 [Kutzneria kofuensis]